MSIDGGSVAHVPPAVGTPHLPEERVLGAAVPLAELLEWHERFDVVAGVTQRGETGDFSLGLWSHEPSGTVNERWRQFRRHHAPRFPAVALSHQVHGTAVVHHARPYAAGWHMVDGYDGHVTAEEGLLLTVMVADCVPIYVADMRGPGLALLHAGWRGVSGGMLETGLRILCQRTGAMVQDLAVHFGVAICGRCYEVGPEVAWAVRGEATPGPTHLDLRAELARQARRLGIHEISVSTYCSACDADRFFSHRGSNGDGGRMVAYLGRPAKHTA